jgi:hypothetical protein
MPPQISSAGVEIGQGLYTKVAQAVAYKLGIDLSLISVVPTSSDATPANTVTGGSGTSETCVMVRRRCCCLLVSVCAPVCFSVFLLSWEVSPALRARSALLCAPPSSLYAPTGCPAPVCAPHIVRRATAGGHECM